MSRHLVVMAAGTGGHIIPGLAVAEELRHRGWTVSWLGTAQGMENRLVPASGRLRKAGDRDRSMSSENRSMTPKTFDRDVPPLNTRCSPSAEP